MTFSVLSAILAMTLGLAATVVGVAADVTKKSKLTIATALIVVALFAVAAIRFALLG